MATRDTPVVYYAVLDAWLPEKYLSNEMCAQAAGLCGFSGFKSDSALRLGKAESRSLAARVAVQATTVSPSNSQFTSSVSRCTSCLGDESPEVTEVRTPRSVALFRERFFYEMHMSMLAPSCELSRSCMAMAEAT